MGDSGQTSDAYGLGYGITKGDLEESQRSVREPPEQVEEFLRE